MRSEPCLAKKKELLRKLVIDARECRRGAGGAEGEAGNLLFSISEDAKVEDVEGNVEMTLEDEAKRGLEDVRCGGRGWRRRWKTLRPQANEAGREEVQGDGEMTLEDEQRKQIVPAVPPLPKLRAQTCDTCGEIC